jgi:hypothetical protein
MIRNKKHRCPQGCMAFHVHEMTDGTYDVFFDDMPVCTGISTETDANQVKRDFCEGRR